MIDGTAILSWKSATTITRGKIESIGIESGGTHYNVNNPPRIVIDVPRDENGTDLSLVPTSGATGFEGERATAELVVDGSLKEVYIEKGGLGYPNNISIDIIKDPTDTEYTGFDFSQVLLVKSSYKFSTTNCSWWSNHKNKNFRCWKGLY